MTKNALKFTLGFLTVLGLRLIPGRPPNVEPILATVMPFSKKYGALGGFLFAFASMVLYDVITQKVGLWTWITAGTYGAVGFGAYFFFKRWKGKFLPYLGYSIIGTLIFDAITGLGIGPLFYGQPLIEAFTGQIPFSLQHLASNMVLAVTLSPLVERWVVGNEMLQSKKIQYEIQQTRS